MTDYAVYKGEEIIDIGTAEELSKKLKVSIKFIQWMSTPTARKRNKGNRMIAIKLEDDEDE